MSHESSQLDAFCTQYHRRVERIHEGNKATVFPFDISASKSATVTVFSQGLELSANDIRKEEHLKDFPGASLVIVETSSEWFDQQLSTLGVFLNAINCRNKLRGYSVIVLCTFAQLERVKHYIRMVCPYIECAFYYEENKKDKDPNALTETVTPVALGHWLKEKPSSGPRGSWEPDESRHNLWSFPEGRPVGLFEHFIRHYSQPSDYILVVNNLTGYPIMAAANLGRHCLFTEAKPACREKVLQEIRSFKEKMDLENESTD